MFLLVDISQGNLCQWNLKSKKFEECKVQSMKCMMLFTTVPIRFFHKFDASRDFRATPSCPHLRARWAVPSVLARALIRIPSVKVISRFTLLTNMSSELKFLGLITDELPNHKAKFEKCEKCIKITHKAKFEKCEDAFRSHATLFSSAFLVPFLIQCPVLANG